MEALQLAGATGADIFRARNWLGELEEAMPAYLIATPVRQAAFLAQIGHESGGLRFTRELWGPTPAQVRYEGRADLGNTQPGDGRKYLGRGLIQITGRNNYGEASRGLGVDFVARPALLETPKWATLSAAWWWNDRGLNELADDGQFDRITKRINGGMNGADDRRRLWQAAKTALGVL